MIPSEMWYINTSTYGTFYIIIDDVIEERIIEPLDDDLFEIC